MKRAAAVSLGYLGYEFAAQRYAYMILGSAATEQLFMQRLEGSVELELCCKPFSTHAELRGQLTPIMEAPRPNKGFPNHRALGSGVLPAENRSKHTRDRFAAAAERSLPPVAMVRQVAVMAPMRLLAVLFGNGELHLYCRKSRAGTEYFTTKPQDWSLWTPTRAE